MRAALANNLMAQYKDPMASEPMAEADTAEQADTTEKVQTPPDGTFWIPGDLLGGKCKAGDRYTVEATGDPDEDGDVPVKLVSEAAEETGEAGDNEDPMRMAFASKPTGA